MQKQQIKKYQSNEVNLRHFKVYDYVLRSIFAASQEPDMDKLGLNWEEPCRITEIKRKGSYKLEEMDGNPVKAN